MLGENAQPDLLNERLSVDGVPLLPGKLQAKEAVVESPDKKGWTIELVDHPLSRTMKDVSEETRHLARISGQCASTW